MEHSEGAPPLRLSSLISQLAVSVGAEELARVQYSITGHKQLKKHLCETAFTHLLGLDEDDAPGTDDPADIDAGLTTAQEALNADGFPELSTRLATLTVTLPSCTSCSVLGADAGELADKPSTTPFTEHNALLRFLLSLKGTAPSVRRRTVSFQPTPGDENATDSASRVLQASLFAEAPNPDALFDPGGTAVLLPAEAGAPAGVFSGLDEVTALAQGLTARPTWAPASAQGLPPLQSGGWLPISPALMEHRAAPAATATPAPPQPLNVPLSTLAMDRTPGAVTGFGVRETSPLVRPQGELERGVRPSPRQRAPSPKKKASGEMLLGSGSLWTLEEAELARDALLALQGVHVATQRLRGALAAAGALHRPAAAGVLRKIERAAAARQRLQGLADAFAASPAAPALAAAPDSNTDPVLSALAAALNDVLLALSSHLSSLEVSHATDWVRSVQLGVHDKGGAAPAAAGEGVAAKGKVLQGRGLSLTRVAVLTGRVQSMLRGLAAALWCGVDSGAGGLPQWAACPPPRGPALLSALRLRTEQADPQTAPVLRYLLTRAAAPYLSSLKLWAFTTAAIDVGGAYTAAALPQTLRTCPETAAARSPAEAVPGPLPDFLAHLETPLLRCGAQLRLLHSAEAYGGQELAAALCSTVSVAVADTDSDRWVHLGLLAPSNNRENIIGCHPVQISVGDGGTIALPGLDPSLLPWDADGREALAQRQAEARERAEEVVAVWLRGLEAERAAEEAAVRAAAAGAAAAVTLAVEAEGAARAEALSRRQSVKAALLQEQVEAIAEARLRKAGGTIGATDTGNDSAAVAPAAAAAAAAEEAESVETAQKSETITEPSNQLLSVVVEQNTNADPKQPAGVGNGQSCPTSAAASAAAAIATAPVSATLESAFAASLLRQYRTVSAAATGLVLDHLRLHAHLTFLRRAFFLEAGDWGDEFLHPLDTRVVGLQPLGALTVRAALQDALRSSSLEFDPLAGNLEAELLTGPTAPSAFLAALTEAGPGLHPAASLPRGRASAPVLVSPAALDGLDCVLLRYRCPWPLGAILSEDCAVGYAAVFSAMLRVRRVAAALRRLRGPLASRGTPAAPPPRVAVARAQRLRVFAAEAAQMAAAVQLFQGLATGGPRWTALEAAAAPGSPTAAPDLHVLLDLHRAYVAGSTTDCLTFCGREGARKAAEAALSATAAVAAKVTAAVDAGRVAAGVRASDAAWMRALATDATWDPIAAKISEFGAAAERLQVELAGAGVAGPLAGLAAALPRVER